MSDAQAGTPEPKQDGTNGGTPAAASDGSGNDEQKWQEALKWKQKAEEYNKLDAEKKAIEARYQELERVAYGRGAGQATDPTAELVAQLKEQAAYDPASKAALMALQRTAVAEAEVWLSRQTASVPESKRELVADLIRQSGYNMGKDEALRLVTDPDSEAANARVKQLEAENERLRTARPNGASPSATVPSADAGAHPESMTMSEYLAALNKNDQRAKDLMRLAGTNKLRLTGNQ